MDPFVAEIRIFPFNFPPRGWAACNGQLMPISQYTALFSLLATNYGGDGKSTFGLPNLQGAIPVHAAGAQPGPGLSPYFLGESDGIETVTLQQTEMPQHNHGVAAETIDPGDTTIPAPALNLANQQIYGSGPPNTTLSGTAAAVAGGSQAHTNLMPYVTVSFNIALQGVYPPRS